MVFDFAALSAHEQHKILISTVLPRPIAWVSTLSAGGAVNLAPFSFFNVVCEDPPLLCLGIGKDERETGDEKDTAANIRRDGAFVVNLVGRDNVAAMAKTAMEVASDVSEADLAAVAMTASLKIRVPRVAQSPVAFECVTYDRIELGERRVLILGRVLAAHVRDDGVLDRARCHVDWDGLDCIGRLAGNGWYAGTRDRFQAPTPVFSTAAPNLAEKTG